MYLHLYCESFAMNSATPSGLSATLPLSFFLSLSHSPHLFAFSSYYNWS